MNQLIPDLPFAEYLKLRTPDGDVVFSNSHMKLALDAPRRLKHALENPEDPKKECFLLGRALHARTLENRQSYIIRPDTYPEGANYPDTNGSPKKWNGNSTWCKQWMKDHAEHDVLSSDQHQDVLAWDDAIKATSEAMDLLSVPGHAEVSATAIDEETGLPTKCRFDWLPNGGTAIIDIKTCQDASPEGIKQAIESLDYDQGGFHYIWTHNRIAEEHGRPLKRDFVFIFVEKAPPHIVQVYVLDPLHFHTGRRKRGIALERIKIAVESGIWAGYSNGKILTVPGPSDYYCRKWGL